MSKTKNSLHNAQDDDVAVLRRISRLLEILVRLDLERLKRGRSQAHVIHLLDSIGCGQSEIASLLGTTSNTVNVVLYRAKKRNRKK